MKAPTLGEFRPFLSKVSRYSVCMQETLAYENYLFLTDVPEEYDQLYVYGIGAIEDAEFFEGENGYDGWEAGVPMSVETPERPNLRFRAAIELMLSQKPRSL